MYRPIWLTVLDRKSNAREREIAFRLINDCNYQYNALQAMYNQRCGAFCYPKGNETPAKPHRS